MFYFESKLHQGLYYTFMENLLSPKIKGGIFLLLIKIKNVKKYYEDRLVLDIEDFELMDGDRIGLVGRKWWVKDHTY